MRSAMSILQRRCTRCRHRTQESPDCSVDRRSVLPSTPSAWGHRHRADTTLQCSSRLPTRSARNSPESPNESFGSRCRSRRAPGAASAPTSRPWEHPQTRPRVLRQANPRRTWQTRSRWQASRRRDPVRSRRRRSCDLRLGRSSRRRSARSSCWCSC